MRLIDADAFDKCLENAEAEAIHMRKYVFASAVNVIRGNLKAFPTIEPERPKGKWIPQDRNESDSFAITLVCYFPKCSECGHSGDSAFAFCPWCGADMRGEQKKQCFDDQLIRWIVDGGSNHEGDL